VDFIKKTAELESRIAYLTAEKEILAKDRGRVEIENNKLKREK
jgi:chromosome segregation ATPase